MDGSMVVTDTRPSRLRRRAWQVLATIIALWTLVPSTTGFEGALFPEPSVIHLADDNFEHATQASTGATSGDWLVLFTRTGCDEGRRLSNIWRDVSRHLRGRANVAVVDTEHNPLLVARFNLLPTPCAYILLFRQGALLEIDTRAAVDALWIEGFVAQASKLYVGRPVPKLPTVFSLAKSYIHEKVENLDPRIAFAGVCVAGAAIISGYCLICNPAKTRSE